MRKILSDLGKCFLEGMATGMVIALLGATTAYLWYMLTYQGRFDDNTTQPTTETERYYDGYYPKPEETD